MNVAQSTSIVRLSDMTPTTPVVIQTGDARNGAAGAITLSVADVLRWIAPGAPEDEALKFLMTCQAAGVNPLLKEAELVPLGGRWSTIITISGWLKRVQAHPDYSGHDAGIIVQAIAPPAGAKQPPTPIGPILQIEGTCLPPGHIVVGGWARIWRKNTDRPTFASVSCREYKRDTKTWNEITCTMIRKTALVHACRESGLLESGWYDECEIQPIQTSFNPPTVEPNAPRVDPNVIEVEYRDTPDSACDPAILWELKVAFDQAGAGEQEIRQACFRRGVQRLAELSTADASAMLGKLNAILAKRRDPAELMGLISPIAPQGPAGSQAPHAQSNGSSPPASAADSFMVPDHLRRDRSIPSPAADPSTPTP
jgi:hypothetical protein